MKQTMNMDRNYCHHLRKLGIILVENDISIFKSSHKTRDKASECIYMIFI